MKYLVTGAEMKQYDKNTIEAFGMPSLVLMERAALCAAEEIVKRKEGICKILIVAGSGNNGGDGLAIGRILSQMGHAVTFVLIGERSRCSKETLKQINILENYGFPIQGKITISEYDIVVDALFGIGLTREVTGDCLEAVNSVRRLREMNRKLLICSVDIPSGIHADTGEILGSAVHAHVTVTFGFPKRGHFLHPGREYTGELVVRDIGITEQSFLGQVPSLFTYDDPVGELMPGRDPGGNKGTFGKVLIIASSKNMSGACELAGRACFRTGAGMVRIVTHAVNREIIQKNLPEAMLTVYEEPEADGLRESLLPDLKWADCVVMGPGMGTSEYAALMLTLVLEEAALPLVLDADGLRLLAARMDLQNTLSKQPERQIVLTPHMGEFAGLAGCNIKAVQESHFAMQRDWAQKLRCTIVCKDARTYVCRSGPDAGYLNITGNDGMATAGSGDVLAGIIGGLLAQGMDAFRGACLGVYLHGLAGDHAAGSKSRYAMMAADIAEAIPAVLKNEVQ